MFPLLLLLRPWRTLLVPVSVVVSSSSLLFLDDLGAFLAVSVSSELELEEEEPPSLVRSITQPSTSPTRKNLTSSSEDDDVFFKRRLLLEPEPEEGNSSKFLTPLNRPSSPSSVQRSMNLLQSLPVHSMTRPEEESSTVVSLSLFLLVLVEEASLLSLPLIGVKPRMPDAETDTPRREKIRRLSFM